MGGPQPRETPLADQVEREGELCEAGRHTFIGFQFSRGLLQGSSPANCPALCRIAGISVYLGTGLWAGDCSFVHKSTGRSGLARRVLPATESRFVSKRRD